MRKYWLKAKTPVFVAALVAMSSIASWAGTYYVLSADVKAAKAEAAASEQWAAAVEEQATEMLEKLEAKLCAMESGNRQ